MKGTIFTLLFFIVSFSLAQNCFSDFVYYRSISVNNPSSDSLKDVQVRFDFETAVLVDSGKLQLDASDLRILDANCEPVPFYLDSATNASMNSIWLRLDSLPAMDSIELQMYYGNDSVTAVASGDETFIFFDDFSGDSVDLDKWEPIGGFNQLRIVNGRLEYASSGSNPGPRFKFVRTKASFSEEVIFEFNAEISNTNGFGFSSADSILERILFRQSGFGFDTLNQVAQMNDTLSNGISTSQTYPLIRFPRNQPTDARIQAGVENNILNIYEFTNLSDSSSAADTLQWTQSPSSRVHFILSSFINFPIYLDYLRVRRPIPSGVNVTVGDEVLLIMETLAELPLQAEIQAYPNPAKDYLILAGLPGGSLEVSLYNIHGQEIWQSRSRLAGTSELRLQLPHLSEGIYWLKVSDDSRDLGMKKISIQQP